MQIFHIKAGSVMQPLDSIERLPSKGYIWIDCGVNDIQSAFDYIHQLLDIELEPEHKKLLQDHGLRRFLFDMTQQYDFLRVDTVIPTHDAEADALYHYAPISGLIFDRLLVTLHDEKVPCVDDTQKFLVSPNANCPSSPRLLLILLMHELIEDFYMIHEPLARQYSGWQRKILNKDKNFTDWDHILIYKDQLRHVRVVLESCQSTFRYWWQAFGVDTESGNQQLTQQLQILNQHVQDQMQVVLNMENDLATLMDLHFSVATNKTNDVMRILTVIAGTFLPLNLITGIFGMNFHHMAGLQSQYGYYYTLLLMIFMVVGIIWYCRWRRLF